MEPSTTPQNMDTSKQNTKLKATTLPQEMLFKKRPVVIIMVLLLAIVVSLVWVLTNGATSSQMQAAADKAMSALTSDKSSDIDSLVASDNPLIKNFYEGAQSQMRGGYKLVESTEADGSMIYRYALEGASAAQARVIVTDDAKVSSIIFGSEELAKRTEKFKKDEVSQELLESRKSAGYRCLEQQDYSLTNFDVDEQDMITWSTTYEPTSTTANKMMTVFFNNGSSAPSQSINVYRNWGRFAVDMHDKQWMIRIRPVIMQEAVGTVREDFDYAIAQERAQFIRTKLIEADVMEDRIVVDEPYISDTSFDQENEPVSRRVDFIIDPTCLQ